MKEWAQAITLEPMEENDTEESYVSKCESVIVSSAPNWKVDVESFVTNEIRKVAKAAFEKYHPSGGCNESADGGGEEEEAEEGEEMEEEGEVAIDSTGDLVDDKRQAEGNGRAVAPEFTP